MPSDEEEIVYHEIFTLLDSNGNGVIGLNELSKIMTVMESAPPLAQIEEIFKQCDEDGNGAIDADEFINVVETVKLLQNRTTAQILESIKAVKYTELFRLADPSGTDILDTSEVSVLLARLPTVTSEAMLSELAAKEEVEDGKIHLEGFRNLMFELTRGLKIQEALEHCRKGLREMLENREAKRFYSNLERSKSNTGEAETEGEIEGVEGCEGCQRLKGRVKHHELQVEAERAIIRELRSGMEDGAGRLEGAERMNKDLVFENEKLKKKLREYESGAAERKQKVTHETEQMQHQLQTALNERTRQLEAAQDELETLKKQNAKQRQESARQASALALLHKHVAQLEKDNEVLKRGGDREHIKEYIAKQKVLSSKLEEANKTIESMQQNSWYEDKLQYLTSQKKGGGVGPTPMPSYNETERAEWKTDPSIKRVHPGSVAVLSVRGVGNTFKKTEIIGSEPTEEEYRVLSNYYHKYLGAKGTKAEAQLAWECGDELTKVGAHHPAYWTGKNYARLKCWMRQPVVDSIASSNTRKRYVIHPSQPRSASTQPPSLAPSPSIPPSAAQRSISPTRKMSQGPKW